MIAQAGLLSYRMGFQTALAKSTCTQRSVPLFCGSVLQQMTVYTRDSGQTKCMSHGDLDFSGDRRTSVYTVINSKSVAVYYQSSSSNIRQHQFPAFSFSFHFSAELLEPIPPPPVTFCELSRVIFGNPGFPGLVRQDIMKASDILVAPQRFVN
jgi:hypothetical protein